MFNNADITFVETLINNLCPDRPEGELEGLCFVKCWIDVLIIGLRTL